MRQQLLRHCFRTVFPVRVSGMDSDAHHFVLKFVGGIFTRFVLSTVYKKDFENE